MRRFGTVCVCTSVSYAILVFWLSTAEALEIPVAERHENEAPLILFIGGTAAMLLVASKRDCATGDSPNGCTAELSGLIGAATIREEESSRWGIAAEMDVYFHLARYLRIGFGATFAELSGTPPMYIEAGNFNPWTGHLERTPVDRPLDSDTYTLDLALMCALGGALYVGGGVGYFIATTDQRSADAFGSGWEKFGGGVSYQVFIGFRPSLGHRKSRFLLEVKLTQMKATSEPSGIIEEGFYGEDFGGATLMAGFAF